MEFLNEFGNKKEEVEYTQTENFSNSYLYFFMNKLANCQENVREKKFSQLEDEEGNLYCYFDEGYSYSTNQIGNYINYIIVEKDTKNIFTNIKSNNYQQVMENMKQQKIYWNLNNGKIETNLTYINQDNIKYNYNFNHISYKKGNSGDLEEEKTLWKDYDIYSFYNEDEVGMSSNFLFHKEIYDFMLQNKTLPIYTTIFSSILLLIIAIYLFWSIGYKKAVEGISLNTWDKMPYEIASIICFNVVFLAVAFVLNSGNSMLFYYTIVFLYVIAYIIAYIACAILGITTIKRIKAKTFWKSFLTYKIIRWLYHKMKKFIEEVQKKTPTSRKIFWSYWGFIGINLVIVAFFIGAISIFLLLAFWIAGFYIIRKYVRQQDEIKEALEKIYQGDNTIYLDTNQLQGILKEMAVYINDIAGGFSNAIEESLKSERLKTELITNVSHDIKTPLTSIINYVDLLKKEDLQDEKIKEYVEILDRKSQRLKKLTEDLVEASKVSSGNVQLNIELINLKELLNQSIGEFRDRFEEKKLQIETNLPKEEIKIKADNRYLYRVIENLFSNVTKYALDHSRVYIDMTKEKNKIIISIKNISKDKLNISSEELMQRFVRGDKSRYTEGSGLGLSIAKSLTELQGGKFDIHIDGDLFKVTMQWQE